MFWDTLLNILGIIGIVAVSAFIIVFLVDLFISIVDGTNGIFFKRKKDVQNENIDRPKLLPKTELEVIVKQPEEQQVGAQPQQEALPEPVVQQNPVVEEPVIEKHEEAKENIEQIIEQVAEEVKAQYEKEEALVAKQQNEQLKSKLEEEKEEFAKKQQELEDQIADLKSQLEDNETKIKDLSAAKPKNVQVDEKDEILAKLDVLKQRLKENDKELSANKKEFIPLKRVNNTLDSDKKKLRRKEAIVAKRKVVLYGVNNYVDIDEQKAKELAEELDLLEGLRLSVQHCEEVMQKNKDRYPILERANHFLVRNSENIKADIAELEEKLKLIEQSEASGNSSADEDDFD